MSGIHNTSRPVTESDVVLEIYDLEARVHEAMLATVVEARILVEQGRHDEALRLLRSSGGRITGLRVRA